MTNDITNNQINNKQQQSRRKRESKDKEKKSQWQQQVRITRTHQQMREETKEGKEKKE